MAQPPVVDASPLIFLSKVDLLDLLKLAGEEVIVPAAVDTEIRQSGTDEITVKAVEMTNWLRIVATPSIPEIISSFGNLGKGESSVLSWAYAHPGTEAILDDLTARRCAALIRVPVRGTLGLVLTAKQRGIIPAARPVIEQLCRSGMYLSESVVNQALTLVGE